MVAFSLSSPRQAFSSSLEDDTLNRHGSLGKWGSENIRNWSRATGNHVMVVMDSRPCAKPHRRESTVVEWQRVTFP